MKGLPQRPLAPHERAELGIEIVVAYARARRQLRRAPLDRAVEELRNGASLDDRGSSGEAVEEARRLGRATIRTLAFLPGDTRCLRRSLVVLQLLARRGIACRLVIGARGGPDFLAHAWIESGGVAVLSPFDGSFGRLLEL